MFILKNETIQDDIKELFEVKKLLAPLKKKEKILADQIKKRMKKAEVFKEFNMNHTYYAERTPKIEKEICPADLYKKIDLNTFFNLVKVKITETKEKLGEKSKDFKELVIEKTSFSLSIKEVKRC